MSTVSDAIDALQTKGQYAFSLSELIRSAEFNEATARKAVRRLQQRRRLARVWRDFWLIIPLEYSGKGMLPAEWFIDSLMKHIGSAYCVGLLSAAALHGAAHQQPQIFQVLIPGILRPVHQRGVHIRFYKRVCADGRLVEKKKTPTGYLACTRAELTLLHLVAFMQDCGGLQNVYSVTDELAESLDSGLLLEAALAEARTPVLQRAGWMLHTLGHESAADAVYRALSRRSFRRVLLDTSAPTAGLLSDRWRIIENALPEKET